LYKTIFQCPHCYAKITIDITPKNSGCVVDNFCPGCSNIMIQVVGKKPISITSEGITVKENDELYNRWLVACESSKDKNAFDVKWKYFESLQEKLEYMNLLNKLGVIRL